MVETYAGIDAGHSDHSPGCLDTSDGLATAATNAFPAPASPLATAIARTTTFSLDVF